MYGSRSGQPVREGRAQGPAIGELMLLIAGLGIGLWLILDELREIGTFPEIDRILLILVMSLGGLAFVGPPLLLWHRWKRDRRPWRAGHLLWFSTGTSAWLLWPPIAYQRVRDQTLGTTTTGVCFAYGTPLMALYVTLALLAGGRLRRRRRFQRRRGWRETFGLLLGLAWAGTGLYVLYLLYAEDFKR